MQIKTAVLQELLAKAVKGVGNNKLIPITALIGIEVKDNRLTITSTDFTNYLFVSTDIESEDFYVCIQSDTFAKLISKTTSDTVTLTVKENSLEVKGDGTYNIEIPLDENGTMVKYPNPIKDKEYGDLVGSVSKQNIKAILSTLKSSIATTTEFPQYDNYYLGENAVATDTWDISILNKKMLDTPKLVSSAIMDLLDVIDADSVDIYSKDKYLTCVTPNCVVYGSILSDVADFGVEQINKLAEQSFTSMCKLPKTQLQRVLDRISLFVDAYDDKVISVAFSAEGVTVSSRKSNGVETIGYIESDGIVDFTANIDIERFQAKIKATVSDVVEIWYGGDNAIKIVDGDTIVIMGLVIVD